MIKIENLTKTFDGYAALDDLTLTVPTGSIYALMGLNGAGKTTLIRHISDYLLPDEGSVTIDGKSVHDNEALKARMQVIPDELYFPRGYTPKKMAAYYRDVYPGFDEGRFEQMVRAFGLPEGKAIHTFSKGMKKQTAFALSLAARPDYFILDEPVDGLDPIVRKTLWRFLMEDVADREMTVLISSHNAKEMEDVCNYIGILANGKAIFEGDLLEMMPVSIEELFVEKLGGAYHD